MARDPARRNIIFKGQMHYGGVISSTRIESNSSFELLRGFVVNLRPVERCSVIHWSLPAEAQAWLEPSSVRSILCIKLSKSRSSSDPFAQYRSLYLGEDRYKQHESLTHDTILNTAELYRIQTTTAYRHQLPCPSRMSIHR